MRNREIGSPFFSNTQICKETLGVIEPSKLFFSREKARKYFICGACVNHEIFSSTLTLIQQGLEIM